MSSKSLSVGSSRSVALEEFWHAANVSIKRRQRIAVNCWHEELWRAIDALKESLRRLEGPECDTRFRRAFECLNAIKFCENQIPWLDK